MFLRHNTQKTYHIRRLLKSSVNKPSGIRSNLPKVYRDHICCSSDLDLKVNFTQCTAKQTLSGAHALQKQQMSAKPAAGKEVQHLQERKAKASRTKHITAPAFVTGHMQRTCISVHAHASRCHTGQQCPVEIVLDIQLSPYIATPDQTPPPHRAKDTYLFVNEGRYLAIISPGCCCL